jgi:hypothetical protein
VAEWEFENGEFENLKMIFEEGGKKKVPKSMVKVEITEK